MDNKSVDIDNISKGLRALDAYKELTAALAFCISIMLWVFDLYVYAFITTFYIPLIYMYVEILTGRMVNVLLRYCIDLNIKISIYNINVGYYTTVEYGLLITTILVKRINDNKGKYNGDKLHVVYNG